MINSIFEKKNAIYDLDEKKSLPFNREDLKIKSGQTITSTTVNRVFNSLVENDLFNEQLTKNVKNSINIPGATVTGSEQAVLESKDGQKFVLTSNVEPYVIIGKRKVEDIQNSISAVSDLSGMYINFIVNDGLDYIVGTMNGLYISDKRESGWRLINENDYFQKSFIGQDCRCMLPNTYLINSEYLSKYSYFIGTADGLYAFYMYENDVYWFMLHPIKYINTLKFNKFDNYLYIGTNNGLYWSDGLRFGLCNNTYDARVNDIYILDNSELAENNGEILIGSSNGLKQSANGYYLSDIEILHTFEKNIKKIGKDPNNNTTLYIELSSNESNHTSTKYTYDIKTYDLSPCSSFPSTVQFTGSTQTYADIKISENNSVRVSCVVSYDNENDLEYYGISALNGMPELTFQTEYKVEEIIPLSEYDYLFNDTMSLSVYSVAGNIWININMNSLKALDINYTFPMKNIMTFDTQYDKNIVMTIGSNLIICKSYHQEREFVFPYGEYSILNDNFYNSDVKKIYSLYNVDSTIAKDRNFIIGTNKNINYIRDLRMCITHLDENQDEISGSCGAIAVANTGIIDGYKNKCLIASSNKIYRTFDNIQLDNELSSLSKYSIITDIYVEGDATYNICTTNGLYITKKTYGIDDELRKFTIPLIKEQMYDNLDPYIDMHIQEYHVSENFVVEENDSVKDIRKAFMEELDKKAPAKLEYIPEGFTTSSPINVFNAIKLIRNDYVKSIEFNDNNSFIKASISNWAADSDVNVASIYSEAGFIDRFEIDGELFDLSKIPYVCKMWNSGMKEINLYVPSTFTHYINNPKGFSNSIYSLDSIERKNISTNIITGNVIEEKSTTLKIIINNNHFKFTNISEIQINGNSLPLKIYKDDKYYQEGRENLFDTIIQPSFVNSLPIIMSENVNNIKSLLTVENELVLSFSCYGTDSQSIRILGE